MLGIGKKFLFLEKVFCDLNIGISKYNPNTFDTDLEGYLTLSIGYLF